MADDDIKPTQSITPSPLVSPPPDERRRQRQKQPQADQTKPATKQTEDDKPKDGFIDEYV